MALKATKMSRFCRLAELAYVETGKLGEQPGHWFLNFKGKRLFFTDDDIHTRLERRKMTLFAGADGVTMAVAVGGGEATGSGGATAVTGPAAANATAAPRA